MERTRQWSLLVTDFNLREKLSFYPGGLLGGGLLGGGLLGHMTLERGISSDFLFPGSHGWSLKSYKQWHTSHPDAVTTSGSSSLQSRNAGSGGEGGRRTTQLKCKWACGLLLLNGPWRKINTHIASPWQNQDFNAPRKRKLKFLMMALFLTLHKL